ncbi:MAG: PD40 domain-containing protein [Rhodobacteraceae bacterium]|nr:PD40 domain-containing protein [Paracoccaceae bacterium]
MTYSIKPRSVLFSRFSTLLSVAAISMGGATATLAAGDFVSSPEFAYPVREIPNIPQAAEVYYASDNYHMIGQTQDPDAIKSVYGGDGNLTYIFTDDGKEIWRVNDHGQDACSFWFPDMKRVAWTSTRDHMDMRAGNWSDPADYPEGAELYTSDPDGKNVTRLTDNDYYEAEVAVSPDGQWIVFGREIDGKNDIWVMRADGSDEHQVTFTDDWQEGHPMFLPDSNRIMYRAWRQTEIGKIKPTPMTIFTVARDGSDMRQHTFDHDMNWAPYPTPDGRHYVFVRIADGNNWDVYLGDLAGGEPKRLTFGPVFDGLPNVSPDGTKLSFAHSTKPGFMQGIRTFIMDVSSLDLGPGRYVPFDPAWGKPVPNSAMVN